eukprot:5778635-Prymnesium_polylepis.1
MRIVKAEPARIDRGEPLAAVRSRGSVGVGCALGAAIGRRRLRGVACRQRFLLQPLRQLAHAARLLKVAEQKPADAARCTEREPLQVLLRRAWQPQLHHRARVVLLVRRAVRQDVRSEQHQRLSPIVRPKLLRTLKAEESRVVVRQTGRREEDEDAWAPCTAFERHAQAVHELHQTGEQRAERGE